MSLLGWGSLTWDVPGLEHRGFTPAGTGTMAGMNGSWNEQDRRQRLMDRR